MSDIPFANRLRSEIIAAITEPAAATRRRRLLPSRRTGLVAFAALLVVAAATGAAARIFASPAELAQDQIVCADDLDQVSVGVMPAYDLSPIETCAKALRDAGRPVPPMVACAGQTVVVLPTNDPEACERAGYQPLPAEYEAERQRAAKLERDIVAIEQSADCVPAEELARRVQALLDASGYSGWTTWVRGSAPSSPCGKVSDYWDNPADGTRHWSIAASIDREGHRIMVWPVPPRSAIEKLTSFNDALFKASAARCWTLDDLGAYVRRQGREAGYAVSVAAYPTPGLVETGEDGTRRRVPANGTIADDEGRGDRYEAGCAIVAGVDHDYDGNDVTVEIIQKGLPG